MGKENGRKAWIFAACGMILVALVGGGLLHWTGLGIPANFNPFGAPNLANPPNLLTRTQLSSLKSSPDACYAALDRAGISYTRPADRPHENGCGLENGVGFTGSSPQLSPDVQMTCAVAAAYTMFDLHVVAPAAQTHFGQGVRQTLNMGTYSCRKIRGGSRMSEHATANAIDISGFILEDGTRISLIDDWDDGGPKGAFLQEIAEGSCRLFNVILGPGDDANHADHFHFDMGPFRRCRYD